MKNVFKNPWAKDGENYPNEALDISSLVGNSIAGKSSLGNSAKVRPVRIIVTARIIGEAHTWTYPHSDGYIYKIPTYSLKVEGTDDIGKSISKLFEVIRFGVTVNAPGANPYTVGLADKQTHIIKSWIPDYKVHSAASDEIGAWQVYGNFLIHDGPDDPLNDLYASIGCIEICRGPKGFNIFNDTLISISGVSGRDRDEKLKLLGSSGKITVEYEKAARPPVTVI